MTVLEVVMGHQKGKGWGRPEREERNSNSGLGFMLGNLAMGFDVDDAGVRHRGWTTSLSEVLSN